MTAALCSRSATALACHARGPEGGIASLLPAVVERVPELAPELPLLTAPSLLGVGDKLHDAGPGRRHQHAGRSAAAVAIDPHAALSTWPTTRWRRW